jgi:hypothetical protein
VERAVKAPPVSCADDAKAAAAAPSSALGQLHTAPLPWLLPFCCWRSQGDDGRCVFIQHLPYSSCYTYRVPNVPYSLSFLNITLCQPSIVGLTNRAVLSVLLCICLYDGNAHTMVALYRSIGS